MKIDAARKSLNELKEKRTAFTGKVSYYEATQLFTTTEISKTTKTRS